jgi:hypothetical protein
MSQTLAGEDVKRRSLDLAVLKEYDGVLIV